MQPHQTLFVFDIETIPDTDAVRALTGNDSEDIPTLRKALSDYHLEITAGKNDFPRQPFHKVVAISFLEADIVRNHEGEQYHITDLRTGGKADSSEKELLEGFFKYLERANARLVSFNGRTFDLPVLKYRAMVHGIQAGWLFNRGDKWNNYQQRYSLDWHCDLLEALSDFGASARIKLNEACAAMGFPGKFGVDGAKVADLYDQGKLQDIRDYCETDVLNTFLVYIRYMHHRGTLTTKHYNEAIQSALEIVDNEGDARPHLIEFKQAWEVACKGKFEL
jgi:predicted PolB exonuclease-like 3'-5' exonuclease